jgi:hypothetical protein
MAAKTFLAISKTLAKVLCPEKKRQPYHFPGEISLTSLSFCREYKHNGKAISKPYYGSNWAVAGVLDTPGYIT